MQVDLSTIKHFLRRHGFPQNLPDYSSSVYWNVRYNEEEDLSFEWYVGYPLLRSIIRKHVPTSEAVLEVGSGSSQVLQEMAKD
jgi:SAM-dependent methyltransferase